jgi:hypothetical protein
VSRRLTLPKTNGREALATLLTNTHHDRSGGLVHPGGVRATDAHNAGTLEEAEKILAEHPYVAQQQRAHRGDSRRRTRVRDFLSRDRGNATATGGPYGWDALCHLCFSRYLRLDTAPRRRVRSNGARADSMRVPARRTGWYETIDHPNPRQVFESAIYGAAGVAQHAGLTRLLIEHGADPNDERPRITCLKAMTTP